VDPETNKLALTLIESSAGVYTGGAVGGICVWGGAFDTRF
jgi:hypothetical protein